MIETARVVRESALPEFLRSTGRFRIRQVSSSPLVPAGMVELTEESPGRIEAHWTGERIVSGQEGERGGDALELLIESCRRQTSRFPKSPNAQANLGLVLANAGILDEAVGALRAALALNPRHLAAAAGLSKILAVRGQFDEAIGINKQWAAEHPDDARPLVSMAYIALQRSETDEAIRLLREAVHRDRAGSLPRYQLALLLLGRGGAREALGLLKFVLREDVRTAAVYAALGAAYAVSGQLDRAARAFRTALALEPDQVDASRGLAQVCLEKGEWEDAKKLLEASLVDSPDDWRGRELLARAHFERNEPNRARIVLLECLLVLRREGITTGRDFARVLNNLGVCLGSMGRTSEAIHVFEQAIESQPTGYRIPYQNLARAYREGGELERCLRVLGKCHDLFPNDAETFLLEAVTLMDRNEPSRAVDRLSELVRLEAEIKVPPDAFIFLGSLLVDEMQDIERAIVVMRVALHRWPTHPIVRNNLAYSYLMLGRSREAREVLEGVSKADAEANVSLSATWGLVHLVEGDIERGRKGYEAAEQKARVIGDSKLAGRVLQKRHLEVAKALMKKGELVAARDEVEAGLRLHGKSSFERDLVSVRGKLVGTGE